MKFAFIDFTGKLYRQQERITRNHETEKTMISRLYNVVVVNRRTGQKVVMTPEPVTHDEGCVILSKLTKYPWRLEMLEEVV